LANIGFSFTLNFIAEVTILCGLFETVPTIALLTLLSAIVMGVYSFVIITKTIYGKITSYIKTSYDLSRRETYAMLLYLIPLLLLGIYPTMVTIIICEEFSNNYILDNSYFVTATNRKLSQTILHV